MVKCVNPCFLRWAAPVQFGSNLLSFCFRVGRSSGSRAPTCVGFDHPFDPAQRMHWQFGIFPLRVSSKEICHTDYMFDI